MSERKKRKSGAYKKIMRSVSDIVVVAWKHVKGCTKEMRHHQSTQVSAIVVRARWTQPNLPRG